MRFFGGVTDQMSSGRPDHDTAIFPDIICAAGLGAIGNGLGHAWFYALTSDSPVKYSIALTIPSAIYAALTACNYTYAQNNAQKTSYTAGLLLPFLLAAGDSKANVYQLSQEEIMKTFNNNNQIKNELVIDMPEQIPVELSRKNTLSLAPN
jgi:hypothetical protein